jgi:hypothetical protein
MPLTWDTDSEGHYAAVFDEAGAMRFRLIVEPVGSRWGVDGPRSRSNRATRRRGYAPRGHEGRGTGGAPRRVKPS